GRAVYADMDSEPFKDNPASCEAQAGGDTIALELGRLLGRFAHVAPMAVGASVGDAPVVAAGSCPVSSRVPEKCWLCFAAEKKQPCRGSVCRETALWDGVGRAGVLRLCFAQDCSSVDQWAEALNEMVGALLRRERAALEGRKELAAVRDELSLAYALTEGLRGLSNQREIGECVASNLAATLPADAVVLLAGGEHISFPRVAAAVGLDDHQIVQVAARCGPLLRRHLLRLSRSRAVTVPALDIGLRQWAGPALIVGSSAGRQPMTALVCARLSAVPFGQREQRLAALAARHASLALSSLDLQERLHGLFMGTVRALAAAVDAKDPYTRGHSQRVSDLAVAVAQEMGLPETEIERLQLAALMHDLGKIGVHTSILLKPGPLESDEWRAVKLHPVRGAEILGCVPELQDLVNIVRYHHERLDGSGYPEGLKGDQIPLAARIIAVCDAYDAMVSKRPYRPPMKRYQAVAELRKASDKFDAAAAEALARVLSRRAAVSDAGLRKTA
ncbi:MAG: HD-GYP domain-containing protein, partial [Armatimonadetes bacterium]|nr:HD-GYP domain-containing protein [Armatimonadota bacterium]